MESAPPPYSEGVPLRNNNTQQPRSLARKPVPRRDDEASKGKQQATAMVRHLDRLDLRDGVSTSTTESTATQRKPLSLDQPKRGNDVAISSQPLATQAEDIQSVVSNDEHEITRPPLSQTVTSTSTSSFTSQLSTTSSHLQNAYREARHFVGGLIHHPAESTKHFSILRHSHGLVFYQGTSTSVVVSIFSDAPLPSNRTIWLQNKGWTGKTGMAFRSLVGRTGNWLDVTPTIQATADQLKPSDERAWQRDISHFLKRAPNNIRQSQRLRETIIVRIPVQAQDGYFRLVLCAEGNKKVLCPSPVFRILSTSTDPSSLRGASLSTLPLELGAKLATNFANTVMQSRVTQPITSAVQNYMPSWVGKATTAYDATTAEKVDTVVGNVNEQYNVVRQTSFNHLGGEYGAHDEGPQAPYPVCFAGDATLGLGVIGMPVANLNKVPEIILRRLLGFYFGWVRIVPNKKPHPDTLDQQWYQAVISALPIKISQLARVRIEDAGKKVISVLFIDEEQGFTAFGSSPIEVRILGFLRPHEEISENEAEAAAKAAAEAEMLEAVNDVMSTQALLSRPTWGPEARPTCIDAEDGGGLQKVRSRVVDSRLAAQRRVDSIPLHKAGVRVAVDGIREKSLNAGGIYIPR